METIGWMVASVMTAWKVELVMIVMWLTQLLTSL